MRNKTQTTALAGFRLSTLALAVTAALPAAARAESVQEQPTVEITAQELDYKVERSTSPKYTQPLLDTAKTINVVPQGLMQDRGADSLRDALRNVPGISLAAGEGGAPPGDQMTIRGFDATNNIMIDNVRDVAGYTRDTYNLEAVEVAKGPGSVMYGRGSTGGIINLQQKTAKLDRFGEVSVRAGSEGDHRLQLDGNTSIGDTSAVRVNLLTDDVDVAGRDEVNNAKDALAVSWATGLGTDSRLTVNADIQQQDNLPDYGLPWVPVGSTHPDVAAEAGTAPDVDYSNFYGNVNRDFEEVDAKSLTARYEKDLNDTSMLRIQARTGNVERQNVVTSPRFVERTPSTTSDIRQTDVKTRDTKDSLAVLQADLISQYRVGDTTHDLVLGAEISREKFERWNYEAVAADNLTSVVDLFNPNPNLPFTGRYARTAKDQEATVDTQAIYAFDTITLNPQWQLSGGLRYDIFDSEYFYQLDDSTDPRAKVGKTDRELSWNLGVVYKPAPNGSIYFATGTSFNPSAEGVTSAAPVSRGQANNIADLDPEETITYELGTKWELLDGRLSTSAAIFRTEKTNARTDNPDLGEGYDTLEGEQRVDGLELSLAGQLTEKLAVTAAYTYQDGKVTKALGDDANLEGSELARTPGHSFSLWTRYDLSERLAFGLGAQYVGERYNSTNPDSRRVADDYLVYDMMASYQFDPQWSIQLNGSNLTDEEYVDQVGGGHFVPGEGRYFSLTTRYTF